MLKAHERLFPAIETQRAASLFFQKYSKMMRKSATMSEGTYEDWISTFETLEKKRKLVHAVSVKRGGELDVGYGVLLVLNVKDGKVHADAESIAMNPYEDVWNTQPFLGRRKMTAQDVRRAMDVVSCDA